MAKEKGIDIILNSQVALTINKDFDISQDVIAKADAAAARGGGGAAAGKPAAAAAPAAPKPAPSPTPDAGAAVMLCGPGGARPAALGGLPAASSPVPPRPPGKRRAPALAVRQQQ